tara:strand:- start:199 stop:363 length:165 start_codon:yes stop_codon:yes gene_type:complete
MSQKDKELAKLLVRLTLIFLDVIWVGLTVAIATYCIKSALGIDIFPGWSLFPKL